MQGNEIYIDSNFACIIEYMQNVVQEKKIFCNLICNIFLREITNLPVLQFFYDFPYQFFKYYISMHETKNKYFEMRHYY